MKGAAGLLSVVMAKPIDPYRLRVVLRDLVLFTSLAAVRAGCAGDRGHRPALDGEYGQRLVRDRYEVGGRIVTVPAWALSSASFSNGNTPPDRHSS
jgi:hypothetical protein